MKKIILFLMISVTLCVPGCLGQNGKHPAKQVTAFILSVPCSAVALGNECYETWYLMMDTPNQHRKDEIH